MLVAISHLCFHWKKKKFSQVGKGRDIVLFNHLIPVDFFASWLLCNCLFNEFTWPKMSTKWHCRISQQDVVFFISLFNKKKKNLKFIFNIAISFDSASLFLVKKIKITWMAVPHFRLFVLAKSGYSLSYTWKFNFTSSWIIW